MPNKFITSIIRDKQFSIRLVVIMILIFGTIKLLNNQKVISARFKKLKEEKQLIAQAPIFKKQIEDLEALRAKKMEVMEVKIVKEPVLKGILMAMNVNYAIIDDLYYKEGDDYGDYILLKINLDHVALQNKSTNQQKILYLP